MIAYLETWHIDVEEFLDLRKPTVDDRRRTHDMNTANWVPDEFLRRVEADTTWTLFYPDEALDLHDLYGDAFTIRYREHEAAAQRGEMRVHRTVRAVELWRRMLTMLFETGPRPQRCRPAEIGLPSALCARLTPAPRWVRPPARGRAKFHPTRHGCVSLPMSRPHCGAWPRW